MKDILKAMRDGEVVLGVCCDISDPSVVELLGHVGWDFVLINAEGGTVSPFGQELESMIRAAYAADVTPVVKVLENNEAMIASALKLGAKIIEVPRVNSREEAERAVRAVKYPPAGERMTYWGVPATRYGIDSWADHVRAANAEVSVYVVLEEQVAMDNMEDILSAEAWKWSSSARSTSPFASVAWTTRRPGRRSSSTGKSSCASPAREASA